MKNIKRDESHTNTIKINIERDEFHTKNRKKMDTIKIKINRDGLYMKNNTIKMNFNINNIIKDTCI